MEKGERFKHGFETFVYICACIFTLGFVYVLRIIITQGVLLAILRRDMAIQESETSKTNL